jgi:hypothetical protein
MSDYVCKVAGMLDGWDIMYMQIPKVNETRSHEQRRRGRRARVRVSVGGGGGGGCIGGWGELREEKGEKGIVE